MLCGCVFYCCTEMKRVHTQKDWTNTRDIALPPSTNKWIRWEEAFVVDVGLERVVVGRFETNFPSKNDGNSYWFTDTSVIIDLILHSWRSLWRRCLLLGEGRKKNKFRFSWLSFVRDVREESGKVSSVSPAPCTLILKEKEKLNHEIFLNLGHSYITEILGWRFVLWS